MFGYYSKLALHSFQRSRLMTALMITAIGLGTGAAMTMVIVLHVLAGNPVPGHGEQIFHVQLDASDLAEGELGHEPPDGLTWLDANALMRNSTADRETIVISGKVEARPTVGPGRASWEDATYTTADFFPMMRVPFSAGRPWTRMDDDSHSKVAVISSALAHKEFRGNAVGQTLLVNGNAFEVVGVIDHWRPVPHFYDLAKGAYATAEDVFVPFSTAHDLKLRKLAVVECWGSGMPKSGGLENAPCAWIHMWVELGTAAKVRDYSNLLTYYSSDQMTSGRFARPPNPRLRTIDDWLSVQKALPENVKLGSLFALLLLLLCIVNTMALLLVKFLRKSVELSIRRAMGASRTDVLLQLMIEAALVGIAGGLAGLALALVGLWVVRQQPAQHAILARMDVPMLLATLILSLVATVAAAAIPAWRACRTSPARLLNAQDI